MYDRNCSTHYSEMFFDAIAAEKSSVPILCNKFLEDKDYMFEAFKQWILNIHFSGGFSCSGHFMIVASVLKIFCKLTVEDLKHGKCYLCVVCAGSENI